MIRVRAGHILQGNIPLKACVGWLMVQLLGSCALLIKALRSDVCAGCAFAFKHAVGTSNHAVCAAKHKNLHSMGEVLPLFS